MEVLFDVRTAEFASWSAFAPLAILVAAILSEMFRRRREIGSFFQSAEKSRLAIYLLVCVFLLCITGLQLLSYSEEKNEFADALSAQRTRVVEGEIANYTPQPWTGRPLEKFEVGNERFSFDGFGASPAYHKRMLSGGVLKEGMRVRVFEFRGNILRIELFPDSGNPSLK